jgi:hypothetical protein
MIRDYADRSWVRGGKVNIGRVVKIVTIASLFIAVNSFAYQDDLEQQQRRNKEENIRMQEEIIRMQQEQDQQQKLERSQYEQDIRAGRRYPWQ